MLFGSSVESSCCPFHVLRPSHCPTLLNEQHWRPRWYDIYTLLRIAIFSKALTSKACFIHIPIKGMWQYTSHGHLLLQYSWQCMKVAKFQNVKNIASSKRFYIFSWYEFHFFLPSGCMLHSNNFNRILYQMQKYIKFIKQTTTVH